MSHQRSASSASSDPNGGKVRIQTLRTMKADGQRIAVVTAYDALTARWADDAGLDVVLVGDSLGNTALGLEGTIPVTLDVMVHHCAAVARASRRALRVGDMPFMTYKISPEQALASCGRMIQEGGMEAVKLEGGEEIAPTVARLVAAGLPVMGHIGLLPQSYHAQGGYHIQGRGEAAAARLAHDARCLEEAGAFSIVLECVTPELARRITAERAVPTIGIGSGPACDGQVLVMADLLGMMPGAPARFVKQYDHLYDAARTALERYAGEVREGQFPPSEKGDKKQDRM